MTGVFILVSFMIVLLSIIKPVLGNIGNNIMNATNQMGAFNNGYFLMFILSQIFGTVMSYVTLILNFIGSSTFVTWMNVSKDPNIKEWVEFYLNDLYSKGHVYTMSTTTETATSTNQLWYNKDDFDGYPQVRHIPGESISLLFFNSRPVVVTKTGSSHTPELYRNPGMGSYSTGTISLKTICKPWDRNTIWKEFTQKARSTFIKRLDKKQQIYKIKKRGEGQAFGTIPQIIDKKGFNDGSYVLTPQMQHIVNNVRHFLSPKTKEHYKEHNLSYCHRIYVHGPPGTGKSQLAYRIAGEFNLPIYHLNCEFLSNGDIENVFDMVQRGIIIVEEIDTCIDDLKKQTTITSERTLPTLSGWHKVLDTIAGNQVIVYMTTNNHNLITGLNHGSLIRKERVDQISYIGHLTVKNINDILNKHYGTDKENHVENIYVNNNGLTLLTPADIINIIKMNKGNTEETVKGIMELSDSRSRYIKMMKDSIKNKHIKSF